MPAFNQKNLALSPAATDLGLGDMLLQQREDETEEARRRRMMLEQLKQSLSPSGASSMLGLMGRPGG